MRSKKRKKEVDIESVQYTKANKEANDLGIGDAPATNPLALASVIVSLIGLFTGIGIIGLIMGIVALERIKTSTEQQRGKRAALAGIAIGALGTLLVFAMFLKVAFLSHK